MLDILEQVLADAPNLLQPEGWHSLDIDYHPPRVERCWKQWGEYRVSLHRIYPCKAEDALFHPHPWPSAMVILKGQYEMGVGQGNSLDEVVVAAKLILGAGSRYEMDHPQGWHYVRPLTLTYTVMVTGYPWADALDSTEMPRKPMYPLDSFTREDMLSRFRELLLGDDRIRQGREVTGSVPGDQ